MYIIIQYTKPNYDNIHIAKYGDHPIVFGSRYSAEQHAREHCRLNYKIVEL